MTSYANISAAIPPIYFRLPEYAIADYWNAMSAAAPNTDFIIYNIPQLAGVALTQSLYEKTVYNPVLDRRAPDINAYIFLQSLTS